MALSGMRLDSALERASPSLSGGSPPLTRVRHTALSVKYDYKGESKEKKTVLGYFDKRKVEKAVDAASVVVLIKGIAKTFVATFQLITKRIKDFGRAFAQFKSTYGFGFDALETVTSIYSLYDDGVHAVKAIRKGDSEEARDRSVAFTCSAAALSGNAVGVAAFVEGLKTTSKAALAKSAVLGLTASGLSAAIWATYATIKAVAIKRVLHAIDRLKKAFLSESSIEEKYRNAIDDLRNQIEITDLESIRIHEQVQGLEHHKQEEKLQQLRENLIEKKHHRLIKRVGEKMALQVIEKVEELSKQLHSSDLDEVANGLKEAKAFIKSYKQALNKELRLNITKFIGAVIGFAGAVTAIFNPIGAGILAGVATSILIYSWYQGKYKKPEDFKELSIFGYKFFNFANEPESDLEDELKASEIGALDDKPMPGPVAAARAPSPFDEENPPSTANSSQVSSRSITPISFEQEERDSQKSKIEELSKAAEDQRYQKILEIQRKRAEAQRLFIEQNS